MCKVELMKMFEFGSGLPPSWTIPRRLRCWHRLCAFLSRRGEQRGRRALLLALPPDWSEGLYSIDGLTADDEKVIVKHNALGIAKALPIASLPPFNHIGELRVECNWSEVNASLRSTKDRGAKHYALSRDFTEQEVKEEYDDDTGAGVIDPKTPNKRPSGGLPTSLKNPRTALASSSGGSPRDQVKQEVLAAASPAPSVAGSVSGEAAEQALGVAESLSVKAEGGETMASEADHDESIVPPPSPTGLAGGDGSGVKEEGASAAAATGAA